MKIEIGTETYIKSQPVPTQLKMNLATNQK